jgi:hypothetical protein
MEKKDFILEIYKDPRTVFGVSDVAMLFPQDESKYLSERLRYYIETDRLLNPRKGIYAKPDYNPLELANILYTPSYISLEYVLGQAGVVFQFDSRITSVGYLSRELEIDSRTYSYRRIREDIIMAQGGIVRRDNNVYIATPERAFLDTLYLNKEFYFDNLNPLDRRQINKILPAYCSAALEKRVAKLLKNG